VVNQGFAKSWKMETNIIAPLEKVLMKPAWKRFWIKAGMTSRYRICGSKAVQGKWVLDRSNDPFYSSERWNFESMFVSNLEDMPTYSVVVLLDVTSKTTELLGNKKWI